MFPVKQVNATPHLGKPEGSGCRSPGWFVEINNRAVAAVYFQVVALDSFVVTEAMLIILAKIKTNTKALLHTRSILHTTVADARIECFGKPIRYRVRLYMRLSFPMILLLAL